MLGMSAMKYAEADKALAGVAALLSDPRRSQFLPLTTCLFVTSICYLHVWRQPGEGGRHPPVGLAERWFDVERTVRQEIDAGRTASYSFTPAIVAMSSRARDRFLRRMVFCASPA